MTPLSALLSLILSEVLQVVVIPWVGWLFFWAYRVLGGW